MCCFSKPVRSVTNTRIFCRVGASGYQVVVYSMRLDTEFDHSLYCQSPSAAAGMKWWESAYLSSYYVKCSKTLGVIRSEQHIFKKTLKGKLKNEDLVIESSHV